MYDVSDLERREKIRVNCNKENLYLLVMGYARNFAGWRIEQIQNTTFTEDESGYHLRWNFSWNNKRTLYRASLSCSRSEWTLHMTRSEPAYHDSLTRYNKVLKPSVRVLYQLGILTDKRPAGRTAKRKTAARALELC